VAGEGGFQSAEAEIEVAVEIRRVAIGMRQPSRRQRDGAIVAALRESIDDRSAWIPEAEELRDLVVRLSRRIIASPAEKLVMSRLLDEIKARMSAGHNQHDRRKRQLA